MDTVKSIKSMSKKNAVSNSKKFSKFSEFRQKYGLKKDKPKEPFRVRFLAFIKRWLLRLFHTAFFLLFVYVFLLSIIQVMPLSMGLILNASGFTLTNNAEIILTLLTGMLFVLWIYAGSKFIVVKVLKLYIRNIKKTLSDEVINRFKDVESDDKEVKS